MVQKTNVRGALDLHEQLIQLHDKLRKEKKRKFDRILPFDELLFDRWEKARFLKSKKDSSIYHDCYIYGDVRIGRNTWVGPHTLLDGSGGSLRIGDFCSISSGVQIYTHDTVNWSLTGGKAKTEKKSVTIGNFCYLGPYSIISKGVTIGKNSVIGAHSLVNSIIPSNSIAFGIPAKVVGKVQIDGKKVKFIYY